MVMKPRGDESPQLVQPHRSRYHQSRDSRNLQLEDEGICDPGQGQGHDVALRPCLVNDPCEGGTEPGENLWVEVPTHGHADCDGDG